MTVGQIGVSHALAGENSVGDPPVLDWLTLFGWLCGGPADAVQILALVSHLVVKRFGDEVKRF